jgi:hypothetical protein
MLKEPVEGFEFSPLDEAVPFWRWTITFTAPVRRRSSNLGP